MAKTGLCAYCDQEKELTKDHVPPKSLLDKPLPDNLWVVPACLDCNTGFKSDDEYTRAVLARDMRANWNNAAQVNLPLIARSLVRPEAQGFAGHLRSQSTVMRVVTPSGAPIEVLALDRRRVNNTGLHILRGLYFREFGRALPESAKVRLESKAGLTAKDSDTQIIAKVLHTFPERRDGAIGTAFSFVSGVGPEMSVWAMMLYEYYWWTATVDERTGIFESDDTGPAETQSAAATS